MIILRVFASSRLRVFAVNFDLWPRPSTRFGRFWPRTFLTSRSTIEGERKQVTVLFVDLADYTSLSERRDTEDVHALMTRAFELMLTEVHRYEGTVNQFLGDGIMALFGAPIAYEDHAVRAVHAALGIRKTLSDYEDGLDRLQGRVELVQDDGEVSSHVDRG